MTLGKSRMACSIEIRYSPAEGLQLMAFIICDDHNLSVEADGIDPLTARKLILSEPKPNPTPVEQEIIEFGKHHRECNLRVLAE